jgi:hypothetical protein
MARRSAADHADALPDPLDREHVEPGSRPDGDREEGPSRSPLDASTPTAEEIAEAEEKIKRALKDGSARELDALPPQYLHLEKLAQLQDIELKREYANWAKRVLNVRLAAADAVFVAYAWAGQDWHLEAAVIDVWLGATVVQIVGIALVVTRHLFPKRDEPRLRQP